MLAYEPISGTDAAIWLAVSIVMLIGGVAIILGIVLYGTWLAAKIKDRKDGT